MLPPSCRLALISACLFLLPATLTAAAPADAETRAAVAGKPSSLEVRPAAVTLSGSRDGRQLVVTGKYADGSVRDLTHFVTVTPDAAGLVETDGLFVRPLKDGATALTLSAGGASVKVPVAVERSATADPVSFRRHVVGALNVGGCNMGACHGTPSGKNGFRLSLRGFDPALDYVQLTRDVFGRRADRLEPEASLILQKGLGRVPHEGGVRFTPGSVAVRYVTDWLAEGLRNDPADLPPIKKVEVTPKTTVQRDGAKWQQLAVTAEYGEGKIADVTRLTCFSSSDTAVADVGVTGLVEFKQPGEVAILCRYLDELVTVRLTYLESRPNFTWVEPPAVNYVDNHVFAKLKMLSLPPSELCTDAEFIRRAYLDVCGMLPPPEEAAAFLADKAADKRTRLIDDLLQRPEYADYWTLKWSDVLRSSRKTLQLKGTHAFQDWLRGRVAKNVGIDSIVRELLTANGHTWSNPPANYYRVAKDPQNLAETTGQLFLGVRMQCAKCHNHPFERWTQDDYYSLAAFFARVKTRKDPNADAKAQPNTVAEIVYSERGGEVTQPRTGKVMPPKFPGAGVPDVAGKDRREVFADWLTSVDNPFFAKSVANRVWFHLLGKGIVDPVDDFRESNPACNEELLDALAKDFAARGFDQKYLIRTIMLSRTYQLSAEPNAFNKEDNRYFSHAVTKLLTAEQLLDALCDVAGVPEKFAGLPAGTRAIQLPDGEVNHPFLKTFGQPARELACECERESDSNLAQALQLINGPTINEKLRNPGNRLGKLLDAKKSDLEVLNDLYMTTMSRPPLPGEVTAAMAHVGKAADKRKGWEDVLWALLNTREFLFRH